MAESPVIGQGSTLPTDWQTVKLGQVLQRVRRPVEVEPGATYREIGIRSHGKGIFYKEPTTGAALGEKAVFWVQPDCFIVNIVFAWEQAVAKTTASEVGMIASHRFPMYKPKEGELDLDYVVRFFKTPQGKYLLGLASPGGAGRNKTLGQEAFLDLSVPLPPISEQRKIAAILRVWDKAIALTERRIAAGQQRKQGLMQRLLTGRVRFPEFAQESWAQMQLGSLGHCIRGVSYSPQEDLRINDSADTVRLLRANNIYGARINTDDIQFVVSDRCKSTQYLNCGDIAICMASGSKEVVGKAAMFRMDDGFAYTVGAFCAIFRVPDGASGDFVGHYFQSQQYRKELAQLTAGSSINNLKPSDIEGIRFSMPANPVETAKVADVLSACDRELDLLARKRDALQQQKRGLMQQLLTGRVRVVP